MQNQPGFLDKLRAKPLAHRRTFAFLSSLGITLVIAGVWSVSTMSRLLDNEGPDSMSASASTSLSAFSVIKEQFNQVMDQNPLNSNDFEDFETQPAENTDSVNNSYSTTTDNSLNMATSTDDQEASTTTDILVQ